MGRELAIGLGLERTQVAPEKRYQKTFDIKPIRSTRCISQLPLSPLFFWFTDQDPLRQTSKSQKPTLDRPMCHHGKNNQKGKAVANVRTTRARLFGQCASQLPRAVKAMPCRPGEEALVPLRG